MAKLKKSETPSQNEVPRANRRVAPDQLWGQPITSYPVGWRIGYDYEGGEFEVPQRKQRWGEFYWEPRTRPKGKS